MMKFVSVGIALLAAILSGCSAAPEAISDPIKWEEAVIELQSHPSPVAVGMNEFMVVATEERGRPVRDLIISLRAGNGQWRQAIQDGHSGVYRRALAVPAGSVEIELKVRRKRTENEGILIFPIAPVQ